MTTLQTVTRLIHRVKNILVTDIDKRKKMWLRCLEIDFMFVEDKDRCEFVWMRVQESVSPSRSLLSPREEGERVSLPQRADLLCIHLQAIFWLQRTVPLLYGLCLAESPPLSLASHDFHGRSEVLR